MRLLSIFILSVVFFTSCNDDESVKSEYYHTEYNVVAMQSSVPVDMDNDGIKSKDVLKEVNSNLKINKSSDTKFHFIPAGTATVVYYESKNEGNMMIPYPFQHILNPNEDSAALGFYVTQFIGFSYQLNGDYEIEITEVSTEHQFSDYGVAKSARWMDKDSFSVTITARIYDFKENKWIDTDVEILCQKIDE